MDSGVTQQGNGYELVRQLTLEFSIRSRSEALSMRANIATKSFNLSGQETSPSSVVSDTIRRLDLEVARFSKLLATMPATMDMTGLRISESDLLLILLRSLPEAVKNFCLHHSAGDSYEAYRVAAKRWEDQQRLFGDFGQSLSSKRVNEVEGTYPETYQMDWGEWQVDAVAGERCTKCGSRKHLAAQCTVDLSKTKCFRCGTYGHVSLNCKMKAGEGGKDNGKGKGVVKSDNWNKTGKGKGNPSKGKGKGKKGKMNEVSGSETWDWTDWTNETWTDEDQWWHSEQFGWNVESMQESWNANAWQTADWNETSWNETNWDETPTKQQTDGTGKVVGSLILSPVLHVDGCCSETCQTGLVLEDSDSDVDVLESFGTCVFGHGNNNHFLHENNNPFFP